ncbi:MAG: hypothetical protein IPM82_01280 [Saprospiraceae bacterium]|nr:hypothetical protein [Saprospiraceae bacterium]
MTGVWLYLRYTMPKYQAKSTLLIKSDKQSSGLSEESLLGELGMIAADKNLENEIQNPQIPDPHDGSSERIKLDTQIIGIGRVIESELYKDSPIKLDSFCREKKISAFSITLEDDLFYFFRG